MTPEENAALTAFTNSELGIGKDSVRVQRMVSLAARWEENARMLLKLALELAYEARGWCKEPIHDEQIKSLRALEAEWAGSEANNTIS